MTALAQQAKVGGSGQNAPLPQSSPAYNFDLKNAVTANRLAGLWAMMTGFRWRFLGATVALAIGAGAKTATYLLLRQFVDGILGVETRPSALVLIALAFVGLVHVGIKESMI
jgi:ATP-binding cassette subfamily B protein